MPDLSPVTSREPPGQALGHAPSTETAGAVRSGEVRAETVYLDHLASTPCDPEAAALMHRLAVELCGNASSSHAAGRRAARCVERAREQVAAAIDALPEEIVFTSGATESNNLAILGVAAAAIEANRPKRRVITLGIEHPSVLEPMAALGRRGFEVEFAPVHRDGRVVLDALEERLEGALLLSIQAANNEIGTLQPLREVSSMAAERGVLVHSDAAQILGKAPFSVEDLNLDFASLSAHKCYGPKGVGALWVRGGVAGAPIAPLMFGGGHEGGLRPGTYNAPAIAGFGLASQIAAERLYADAERLAGLRDRLERLMAKQVSHVRINGALDQRLPGATSLTFPGTDADAIVGNLPEFDLSTASACQARTPEPSHVLRAIGLSPKLAYATLRVALGPQTDDSAIKALANQIVAAIRRQLAAAGPRRPQSC